MDEKDVLIKCDNIRKSYSGVQVLDGISFELHKNETMVVLGRSGEGKSVLLKCIIGLVKPDSGSLEIFGKDICCLSEKEMIEIRKKVGFLFQGGALYDSMTVRENLEFPLKRHYSKITKNELTASVEEVLEQVGLLNAIDKMPSELSGGMQKRVALARTLILKPQIMLYDEPTTGLDPVTSKEISKLIIKMKEFYKMSSLVITHDMSCAKTVSDNIYLLKNGKFVKQGSYESLEKAGESWVKEFFQ
ncbi:MAG: ABC transporter ATP-binding protein [Cytophagaceae bacterium]